MLFRSACRPFGPPSPYRGEFFAIWLATIFASPQQKIFSDCKGAIKAIMGTKTRVVLGKWITLIRQNIKEKQLLLTHVPSHVGIYGNECADQEAKKAIDQIPINQPQVPTLWHHVISYGEIQCPPHKTWVQFIIPRHTQQGIWKGSFYPLRYAAAQWLK